MTIWMFPIPREFLKQLRRNRDCERDLMADVEGWEVGTYFGQPLYKTLGDDEMQIHQAKSVKYSREFISNYSPIRSMVQCAVPLRPYLFLINTYKDGVSVKMYLYVLISTEYVLSCTYFN